MEVTRARNATGVITFPLVATHSNTYYAALGSLARADVKVHLHTGGAWARSGSPAANISHIANGVFTQLLNATELNPDDTMWPVVLFIHPTVGSGFYDQTIVIKTEDVNLTTVGARAATIGAQATTTLAQVYSASPRVASVYAFALANTPRADSTYQAIAVMHPRLISNQAAIHAVGGSVWQAATRALTDKAGFTLHTDYDPAKTAAQAGNQMDLVDAPNATAVGAIGTGVWANATGSSVYQYTLADTPRAGSVYAAVNVNLNAVLMSIYEKPGASVDNGAIADAVWDEVQSEHVEAGSFGLYLDAVVNSILQKPGAAVDNEAVADAVWDEAQSGHAGAGTFGLYLNAVAGSVWQVATRALTDKANFTLTSAYDAAQTAAQAGDAMTLTEAYDAAKAAASAAVVSSVQAGVQAAGFSVWQVATRALTDKAGFTLHADYDAAKTAAQVSDIPTAVANGNAVWANATGGSVYQFALLHTPVLASIYAAAPITNSIYASQGGVHLFTTSIITNTTESD